MNPAISVLIFTVSSGAGYGLLTWLFAMQIFGSKLFAPHEFIVISLIGLVLVTLGLLSSTLHLANPKNAWRAFMRVRTSWLSREGVLAILYYPITCGYLLLVWLNAGSSSALSNALGMLAIVTALLTVMCTGMIYASLKPIRQWYNHLTTPLYLLFSAMSGCLLFTVSMFAFEHVLSAHLVFSFVGVATLTLLVKLAYFWFIGKPDGIKISDATGFSQAQVRLLDAGHSADTFLTKEFVFDPGAMLLMHRRRTMILFTFVLPVAIILACGHLLPAALVYMTIPCMVIGLFLERWLFFAEARHVVRLYHGDQQT